MPTTPPTSIITSIAMLTPAPRAWLCDIWGVIHNGVAAFPAAVDACVRFRAQGGHVILISNAPRPADGIAQQLQALHIPRSAYDAILTSGDITREALRGWQGIATLHIGPARDLTLFHNLDIPLSDTAHADRILCSGLYDDTTETPADYHRQLQALAARGVPMLCANPDIKVDRGGKIIYCAGAIAAAYADLGGAVEYAGKPHTPIYTTAFEMLNRLAGCGVSRDDILAIGDGIHTDIPGGLAAGLRTVYVASAIHLDGQLTAAALTALFPDPVTRPHFAMEKIAW